MIYGERDKVSCLVWRFDTWQYATRGKLGQRCRLLLAIHLFLVWDGIDTSIVMQSCDQKWKRKKNDLCVNFDWLYEYSRNSSFRKIILQKKKKKLNKLRELIIQSKITKSMTIKLENFILERFKRNSFSRLLSKSGKFFCVHEMWRNAFLQSMRTFLFLYITCNFPKHWKYDSL